MAAVVKWIAITIITIVVAASILTAIVLWKFTPLVEINDEKIELLNGVISIRSTPQKAEFNEEAEANEFNMEVGTRDGIQISSPEGDISLNWSVNKASETVKTAKMDKASKANKSVNTRDSIASENSSLVFSDSKLKTIYVKESKIQDRPKAIKITGVSEVESITFDSGTGVVEVGKDVKIKGSVQGGVVKVIQD